MRDALLLAVAALSYHLGFTCCALSQVRHWRMVTTSEPSPRIVVVLRITGGLLLLAGFAMTLLRDGPAFGAVLGVVLLCAAAVSVALCLTWQPGLLRGLGRWLSENG